MKQTETYTLSALGEQVKERREQKKLSQQELADQLANGINRSNIAHIEQGLRIPKQEVIELLCKFLNVPERYWKPFTNEKTFLRTEFEYILTELTGAIFSINNHDPISIEVAEQQINELFERDYDTEQTYYNLSRILVFYGIKPMTIDFFKNYLGPDSFKSIDAFKISVENYQKDAIRLFSSFFDAYTVLNRAEGLLETYLKPLKENPEEHYRKRIEWNCIKNIPDKKLPYLGYIAASRVKKEQNERKEISDFLKLIAKEKKEKKFQIEKHHAKTRKKMDSLLRKFNSKIEHGLFSSLFQYDAEILEKEAEYLNPSSGNDIEDMERTQLQAYENLSNYLTADFLDVYVATSMRNDADFVSVNDFVINLFKHDEIRPLKLRYFNPTQSWVEDRIAKGLVEALMLKRANFCIYMAQKEDTFGKDSEASVSLGQGKSVIVYVPKLSIPDENIDSESFGLKSKIELISLIKAEKEKALEDIDENSDEEALHSSLLHIKLDRASDESIRFAIRNHWADYDLYGEADKRITNENDRSNFRKWLDNIIKEKKDLQIETSLKKEIISIFVAVSMRYERRAKVFREVHPLALQVILSTGVLNGILVTRSVDSCAKILRALIKNKLALKLQVDYDNYKLIEERTQSTIRVISRHKLIANAFSTFYSNSINKLNS